jgi:hypothetical protein
VAGVAEEWTVAAVDLCGGIRPKLTIEKFTSRALNSAALTGIERSSIEFRAST